MADFTTTIEDSLESLADLKQWRHDMNSNMKQLAIDTGISSDVLRRVRDYKLNYGKAWVTGNPLVLDKEEKKKDKISPVFKKLVTVIDDLAQVGQLDLLTGYLQALSDLGIHVTFEHYMPETVTKSVERSAEGIQALCNIQEQVTTLSEKIREEDSEKAEAEGFGPKREYNKLINLAYNKHKKEKDISDKTQEALTNLDMAMQSYQYIQNN